MNNIFQFATGELSQDAFICWFFNWFNEGDNSKLKQLVCDFCKNKLDIPNLTSVDIHRQFSRKAEKEGQSIPVKIDVLIILNDEIAVIIEDKTFTSEHSNQIKRYEEGLRILQEQDDDKKLIIEDKAYCISRIISVYWKTGFFYDCDKRVEADKKVDSDYLIELLRDYRNENELIDMYVQKLLDDKRWYDEHSKYWDCGNNGKLESAKDTNLYNHQIAQYTLMREIFPEKTMWKGGDLNYIEHGSSFGRPWTEMWIYCDRRSQDPEGDKRFEIFWRIDADNKGSYISLRLYKPQKGKWDSKYSIIKEHAQTFVTDYVQTKFKNVGSYKWEKIDPGTKDSYKEAEIVHFKIDPNLWNDNSDNLKCVIRALNTEIIDFAQEKYGPNAYKDV